MKLVKRSRLVCNRNYIKDGRLVFGIGSRYIVHKYDYERKVILLLSCDNNYSSIIGSVDDFVTLNIDQYRKYFVLLDNFRGIKYRDSYIDSLRRIRVGDKVLCIKEWNNRYIGGLTVYNLGYEYEVIDVPNFDNISYFLIRANSRFGGVYCVCVDNLYKDDYIILFSDHFITKSEYRRQKLARLEGIVSSRNRL